MTNVILCIVVLLMLLRMRKQWRRKRIQKQIMLIQREFMIACIAEHPQFAERANRLIAAETKANMGVVDKCRLWIKKYKEKERKSHGA